MSLSSGVGCSRAGSPEASAATGGAEFERNSKMLNSVAIPPCSAPMVDVPTLGDDGQGWSKLTVLLLALRTTGLATA